MTAAAGNDARAVWPWSRRLVFEKPAQGYQSVRAFAI